MKASHRKATPYPNLREDSFHVVRIPGLLHSVSRPSLLATATFLCQFFSELPGEETYFAEVELYAPLPLLTAEINHIELIDRYLSPRWTRYSSRMEVAPH
ncbi:hypothetical protein AVEN_142705-1 [Araneus ventricosus]|uniref:Uncharacterized protein n=1 Tax=Araneus ventricosus TaxID=182803 RepID=A0A4Y2K256_ARAVE|nr:hypothetical protein AVEN_142705-1 [Araneus ventricosus]